MGMGGREQRGATGGKGHHRRVSSFANVDEAQASALLTQVLREHAAWVEEQKLAREKRLAEAAAREAERAAVEEAAASEPKAE